ncbi:phosphate signaling complex PhoU family protein [Streptomyces sp. 1222.5]|uniref:phosphate signaling complex PhoU family protein n=1 Tax=Streptomyces sp. 1222.5 TaxID=1881026 RepID=UPI003EBE8B96
MANVVGSAISRATTALLDADVQLAHDAISTTEKIHDLQCDLEDQMLAELARQQQVPADLRVVVTSLQMSADLKRCSDLAKRVANLALVSYPKCVVPPDLRGTVSKIGQQAQRLMMQTVDVILTHDVGAVLQLEQARVIVHHLVDDPRQYGDGTAMDITLVRCCYEQFVDHAASIARRVIYLIRAERVDDLSTDPPYA